MSAVEPGTVLIILAGPYRGKRVVALKTLPSGLLLVTGMLARIHLGNISGPYKVNGVPLKRVNRSYVIATSTKLDVSAVKTEKITDAMFTKPKVEKNGKKSETEFFKKDEGKKSLPADFIAAQREVDAAIMGKLIKEETGIMVRYLKSRFSLSNNQLPHELKF
jgi:large subunit ribosomal protein L6e